VTYTGSSQYLVTSGSGTGTMQYRYKLSSSSSWSSWSTSRPSRTNAGTYNIQYKAAASSDGNYTESPVGSLNVTMNTAAASITTSPSAKSLTYNINAQELVNAGAANGGTIYYKVTTTNSKPTSTSGFSSSIPTRTNAGTYYVWYYVYGDSNHYSTSIYSTPVTVTMDKATPVLSTSPTKASNWTYDGTSHALASGGAMKHSSTNSTVVNGTFSYGSATNAGTHTATWSFTPTDTTNYYSTNGNVGTVTVAKATPVYTAPTAKSNLVYSRGL
jgi:hypothetical protein